MFRSYFPLLNPKLAVCIKHSNCCFKSINWFFWYLNNGVGLSSSSEFSTYLYSNSKTSNLFFQFLEMCSSETFFWLEPGQCFLFLENFFLLKLAFFTRTSSLKKAIIKISWSFSFQKIGSSRTFEDTETETGTCFPIQLIKWLLSILRSLFDVFYQHCFLWLAFQF